MICVAWERPRFRAGGRIIVLENVARSAEGGEPLDGGSPEVHGSRISGSDDVGVLVGELGRCDLRDSLVFEGRTGGVTVEKGGEAPDFFIGPVFAGVGANACFHGEHMFA